MSRRRFISLGGAVAIGGAFGRLPHRGAAAEQRVARDPFTLGVASGDPWPDSVVLWTRLAPYPDSLGDTSMGDRPVEVTWQIASDATMSSIERAGVIAAHSADAHSLHVVVDGLRPGRDYWYRFRVGAWISPTGRTKTAPAAGSRPNRLDLVAASCQSWSAGHYTAHRHIAAEHPDAVLFLGDYIYERPVSATDCARSLVSELPDHLATETETLDRYRAQYAWYRQDADLQASHHAAPWIVTWDDHEVQDNYASEISARGVPRGAFTSRRAAAYRAYWEHLPLRTPPPTGASMTMHRRLRFGSLADVHVLDTRQYRSRQMAGVAWTADDPGRHDPQRTMLGGSQQTWLSRGLHESTATWNVLAQQVMVGRIAIDSSDGALHNVDTWDGYPAAQRRLHDALATADNPVVLTGDLHAGYAMDVTTPSGPVAAEFAATSISSGGDGDDDSPTHQRLRASNPHIRYVKPRRGYLRCRMTENEITVDFRTVPYVESAADAPVVTDRSFVVEPGRRGIQDA